MATGDTPAAEGSLTGRSVTAALWSGLASIVRFGLVLISQVVMARLLGPEQFGLFATSLVVVFFSSYFAEIGLAYGLIQKKTVDDADIRFVFTWQAILGAAVCAIVYFGAPLFAAFFGDDRLIPLLRLLSITCLLNALSATASALLKRGMNFKVTNLANVVSYGVGFILVGMPLALSGVKAEALVIAYLVQVCLSLAILYNAQRHAVRPMFWHPEARGMLRFGGTVLSTNLLNWALTSLDRVVIGRMLSITAVGLYSTASNIVNMPAMTLASMLQPVLYSASSSVQNDRERVRSGLYKMCGFVLVFLMPMFVSIAAVAPTFVQALYGSKWADSAVVLVPLALSIPAYLLFAMSTPALWTTGDTGAEFRLQVPLAIAWAIALVGVAYLGSLTVLAWAVLGFYCMRGAIILRAALRAVDGEFSAILGPMATGVMLSAGVAACVWAVDRLCTGATFAPIVLLADAATGAVALLAGIRVLRARIDDGLLGLVAHVVNRLPRPLARRLAWMLGNGPAGAQPVPAK